MESPPICLLPAHYWLTSSAHEYAKKLRYKICEKHSWSKQDVGSTDAFDSVLTGVLTDEIDCYIDCYFENLLFY